MDYLNDTLAISGINITVWRPSSSYATKHQIDLYTHYLNNQRRLLWLPWLM